MTNTFQVSGVRLKGELLQDCEANIKRYRGSAMPHRWLAAVLLHCEKGFRKIKGYKDIFKLLDSIDGYSEHQVLVAA